MNTNSGNTSSSTDALSALLASVIAPNIDPDNEVKVPDSADAISESDLEAALSDLDEDVPPDADDESVEAAPVVDAVVEPTKEEVKAAKAKAKADATALKAAAKIAVDMLKAAAPVVDPAIAIAEKAAKKAEAVAARLAAKAERDAIKAALPPKPAAIYFGKNKVGMLTHKLGVEKLNELSILTKTDAALTGDDRAAAEIATIELMNGMGDKVKNRASYIIQFMAGDCKGKLNEVIRRAFAVLHRDGKIVSGDKGNFCAELLAKPYDIGTARATGNNTINVLKQLMVLVPGDKGEYFPNTDSIILEKVNAGLGLV